MVKILVLNAQDKAVGTVLHLFCTFHSIKTSHTNEGNRGTFHKIVDNALASYVLTLRPEPM